MKLLTNQDLIDAGYEPGPVFKQLHAHIAGYEAKGITDPKYAMKLLKRDNLLRQDNIIVLAEHYAEICLTELERAIRYFNKTRGGDSE